MAELAAVSPAAVLLTGYLVLMSRYSDEEDFEVGLSRDGSDPIPFRVRVSGDSSFQALLDSMWTGESACPIQFRAQPASLPRLIAAFADGIFTARLENGTDLERFAGNLMVLLEGAIASPEQAIGRLPILTPMERETLLEKWAGGDVGQTPVRCLHELFEEQVRSRPDAIALTCDGRHWTYRELNQQADVWAQRVVAAGGGTEPLIAICMERSAEVIVAILAILKAGGAYVPLDPDYPRDRLAYIVEDAGVRVVLTTARSCSTATDIAGNAKVIVVDSGDRPHAPAPLPRVEPSHAAYVIYTSGSTGKPKGCVVTHANVSRLLSRTVGLFDFGSRDVWTLFHSFAFDFSVWEIWGALAFGGRLVVVPYQTSRSAGHFCELLRSEGVTVLNQTPSAFSGLVDAVEQSPDLELPDLRLVIFGGEALDFQKLRPWVERFGLDRPALVNMYGITETTVHVTHHRITESDLCQQRSIVGRPIDDLSVYILDRHLEPVPAGVAGELFVGGAGLARGYLNRPELTAERFIRHPFSADPDARLYRTGDLVRYAGEGQIEYIGRIDHQVKIRGFRIELGEIESALTAHPALRESCVLVHEPTLDDKRLVAFVIAAAGGGGATKAELQQHLRSRVPEYMVPSTFVWVDALPLTPNGKVNRAALRQQVPLTSISADPAGDDELQSPQEQRLIRIAGRLLNFPALSVNADLFDYGMHSLLAGRMAAAVRQEFGLEICPKDIFETRTVRNIAAHLDASAHRPAEAPMPRAGHRDNIPLAWQQEQLLFLAKLWPNSAAYNCQFSVHVQGALDVAALASSLNGMVERHEILRTTFHDSPAGPVQKVHPTAVAALEVVDLSHLDPAIRDSTVEDRVGRVVRCRFDLSTLPLVRWMVFRLAAEDHVFLCVEHHIIHDGWDVGLQLREIRELYTAQIEDRAPALEPLPIQYADYALWQRSYLTGPTLAAKLGYWAGRLKEYPPLLNLPTDRPQAAVPSFRGEVLSVDVDRELYNSVREFSRCHKVTLFVTMYSAFALLLSRYSGQKRFLIGTAVANRSRRETEGLFGMFVNTVALTTDLTDDASFQDLIATNQCHMMEDSVHYDVPFAEVVRQLKVKHAPDRNPLIQVLFVFHDAAVPVIDFAGLKGTVMERHNGTAKMDINIICVPRAEQRVGGRKGADEDLTLIWEYATDLFDKPTIQRMVEEYLSLLRRAVSSPESRVSEWAGVGEQRPALEPEAARPQLADRVPDREGPVSPADGIEQALTGTWKELLGVAPGGIHDDFFQLGGHSLLAMRLLARVNSTFSVELTIRDLFEARTVEQQAHAIRQHRGTAIRKVIPEDRPVRRTTRAESPAPARRVSPARQCVHELFERQAEDRPDAMALVHNDRRITYADLNRMANGFAAELLQRQVPAGAAVAVCLDRSPEMIAAMLGVLKAGAAYLPLDPAYPADRLRTLLRESGVTALVARSEEVRRRCAWDGPVLMAAEIRGRDENPARASVTRDSLAYVMYTSGSTGVPKGVEVPHRGIVRLFFENDYARFGPEQVFLQLAPFSFDASTFEIWGPLVHGGTCVLYPAELPDSQTLKDVLDREGVTTLWLTSSLFNTLIDEAPAVLRGVEQLLIGGEALSVRHVARAIELLPDTEIVNGYGPTESTTFACCYRIPRDSADSLPIGRPIARTEVYILDEQMQTVAAGESGEIYIGGDGVALGYRNRPELTRAAFLPNPFRSQPSLLYRTGDMGRYRPDGNIEFLGRIDGQVKIRGYRIELGEIENALLRRPQVKQAVVSVYESRPGDKHLAAYVVMPGSHAGSEGELRDFLAGTLPAYMIPSRIIFLDRLPLTPNGKADRQALPVPAAVETGPVAGAPFRLSPIEATVAAAFQAILGVDRVGLDDSFFDLGGHSLMAMRLAALVNRELSLEIPLRDFYAAPTVRAVARLAVRPGPAAAKTTIPSRGESDIAPMSFSQEGLWFLEQLHPGQPTYHIVRCFEMRGPLDAVALKNALDALMQRHEALRTSFHLIDGMPRQMVEKHRSAGWQEVEAGGPESVGAHLREEAIRPFDLSAGVLLRARLIRSAPDRHHLALVIHHIAADAWSMGVLHRELSLFYTAFSRGLTPQLAPLPLQYADYSVWLRNSLSGAALDRQLDYWKQRLAGVPPLQLRSANAVAAPSPGGSQQMCSIPPDLVGRLATLGRDAGGTLFTALLSAFQTLLAMYSGQTDFATGCPVANRPSADCEPLIGYFVNNLAIRANLAGNPTFRELLARNREATLDAFARQETPFEKVVGALGLQREAGVMPLVQAMVTFANVPPSALVLPGLEITESAPDTGTAKFDVTLSLAPRPDGSVAGSIEYRNDLFTSAEAARFTSHFLRILEGAAAAPEKPVFHLQMLGEAEHDRILEEWNATAAPVAELCLHEQIDEQARLRPDSIAVTCGGRRSTFAEVKSLSDKVTASLRLRDIGVGDIVAVIAERSCELPALMVGIWKAGAAYLPLDPAYPVERLSFMLRDSGARVILQREAQPLAFAGSLPVIALAEIEPSSLDAGMRPVRSAPESMAYLMYTSGSTGQPKGVEVLHRGVCNILQWVRGELALDHNDTFLGVTTPCFDISVFDLFTPLCIGAHLVLATGDEARDGSILGSMIKRCGVTMLQATPATWLMLVQSGWTGKKDLKAISIGETLSRELAAALLPRLRALWNFYGPTETTIWSTGCLVQPGEGPVSIGRPMANTRIYILNEYREPVPAGRIGELYIGGAGLAAGYRNRPELSGERFLPDPFVQAPGARMYRTGDLARFLENGSIHFIGRRDNQVKLRGYRIELGEIESALRQHPEVSECAVLLREDQPGNQVLVAYVIGSEDEAALRDFLRPKLPVQMLPSAYVFMPALPRTPNGKTDRAALRAPAKESPRAPGAGTENLTEFRLKRTFAEVLGANHFGVNDDFFESGGNSIAAVRLMAAIEKDIGQRLPVAVLFQSPTVRRLAALIDSQDIPKSGMVPVQPEGSRRPLVTLSSGSIMRRLIMSQAPEQPVLSAAAPGDILAGDSCEQIAARYVRDLREVQPHGPYYLTGWCMSGVYAFEVARQLEQAGEEVGLVILLDSVCPELVRQRAFASKIVMRLKKIGFHARGTVRKGGGETQPYGPERLASFLRRQRQAFWQWKHRVRLVGPGPAETETEALHIMNLAGASYEAGPIEAPVLLVQRSSGFLTDWGDPTFGWGRHAANVEIVHVPGDHVTMFEDPNVAVLAAILKDRLQKAQEGQAAANEIPYLTAAANA